MWVFFGNTLCPYLYSDKYLKESIRQTVVQHEAKQELEVAVLFFVDQVLDDKAPSLVLPCFMHALYLANKHPKRPNEGKIKTASKLQCSVI